MVSAGPVKTFRNASDVKNNTAWPENERQPESEEARPVARGERTVKNGGRPRAKRWRRETEFADVSLPGSRAGGATTSPSELKSLTRNPVAVTSWTALLRGRRLRLPWRIASGSRQPIRRLMSTREREHGELPSPDLSLSDRKVRRGLFVSPWQDANLKSAFCTLQFPNNC